MPVQRIPLTGNLLTRRSDTSFDQAFKNCYPEMVDQSNTFIIKRPGLVEAQAFTAGAGRGIYEWNNNLYSVVGDTLRKGTTTIATLNTSTGPVYFKETGGGTPKLVMHDKTDVWIVNSDDTVYMMAGGGTTYSDWVAATDYAVGDRVIPTIENGFFYEATADTGSSAGSEPTWPTTLGDTVVDSGITWTCKGYYTNIPANLADGIAFLDQYIFLLDSTGVVWNSNVGDPTVFDSTDFISAEMRPDAGFYITEYYNYVVVFGEDSIEMFFDAANASGSPLGRVSEAIHNIGCPAARSVIQAANTLLFVGQDAGGGKSVYTFEGLSPKVISNKPVERILNSEVDMTDCYAFYVRANGHFFYVLTLPTVGKTMVYDVVDNAWHEWSSWNGSAESYFTGISHASVSGLCYLQDEDNGKIYTFNCGVYEDDGNTIKVRGTTDLFDGDTNQTKFMNRLEVIGDSPSTTANLNISWSDDDYKTFITARSVDLADRPILTRLGRFQRRAFRYTFEEDAPLRLEALEVDLELGGYGE